MTIIILMGRNPKIIQNNNYFYKNQSDLKIKLKMNHKIKISIPEPCHQNWFEMTPTEKGRFCSNCQKDVIDFTKATNREILLSFNKNEKLCGRLNISQLNKNIIIPKEKKTLWMIVAATIITFLGLGNQTVRAQGKIRIEQTDKKQLNSQESSNNNIKKYTGILYDENKIPLPGANVFIKGTKTQNHTNFNGEFSIEAKKGDILVISSIGYKNLEFKIRNKLNISIAMKKNDVELLGEVSIVRPE